VKAGFQPLWGGQQLAEWIRADVECHDRPLRAVELPASHS
jgi:hypothetical protein